MSIDDLQSITSDDLFKKKFSNEEINNIVKDIYLSDIVFDYSLVFQDDVAFIEIEESSLIENIFINNNSFIEDDVIISQLKSKESTFLNKEFIKSDIDRIRKLYSFKGFSNALITSSVEKYSENRVNLILSINEGSPSKIVKINFLGNNYFSDGYLNNSINTEIVGIFDIFSTGSNLDNTIFNFDKNKIFNLYKKHGFFDVSIAYELNKVSNNIYHLNFLIREGTRYQIKDINISYNSNNFSDSVIDHINKLENNLLVKDSNFNEKEINTQLDYLNKTLQKDNFQNIYFDYDINYSGGFVTLNFKENRRENSIVNKIIINGNSITKDKTIRSKILFEPGDIIYNQLIEETKTELSNLKYINKVEINSISNDKNQDIYIDIKENKKTGNFLLGGSFSADTGFGVLLTVKDYNILGSGNEIDTSININSERYLFNVTYLQQPFTLPSVKNKYQIFNSERDLSNSFGFKSQKTGIGYNIIFDYDKDISISSGLSIFSEKNHSATKSIDAINDNIGNIDTLELNFGITRDTTNDIFYPSNGSLNSLYINYSPSGISDNPNYKVTLRNNIYKTIERNESFFFISNNIGMSESLDGKLKTVDTFSLGGTNFKGFDYRGIGSFQDGVYLGGNKYFTSTIGYGDNFIFDEKDNILGKIFLTTGSLWDSDYVNQDFDLRTSIGFSLDFVSVIPVSISYAVPIEKNDSDKTRNLNFFIGTSF